MPFIVHNRTRGTVLGERVERARTFIQRGIGLIGRSGLRPGEGLHLCPCRAIHMLFMRFPIDVAFLDARGQVVAALHRVRPWRFTPIFWRARSALELPAGTLQASGTQPGDLLEMAPT